MDFHLITQELGKFKFKTNIPSGLENISALTSAAS